MRPPVKDVCAEEPEWDTIKGYLINKNVGMYYVGGTLCIDIHNINNMSTSVLCLNLDGRANMFSDNWYGIMPKYINDLILEIYVTVKGRSAYYEKESERAKKRYI